MPPLPFCKGNNLVTADIEIIEKTVQFSCRKRAVVIIPVDKIFHADGIVVDDLQKKAVGISSWNPGSLEHIEILFPVVAKDDVFKIVREIDPDIITVGADQDYDIDRLQEAIDKRGLKAKAVRIEKYRDCELDSSCKIIRKIQNTNYEGKIMDHCDD